MKLNITEASKLVGKSRVTIYKMIQKGELSFTLDNNGCKIIDTSELIRLFPNIKIVDEELTKLTDREVELTHRVNILETELKAKNEVIEVYKKTLQLLENKLTPINNNYTDKKIGFWRKLFSKKV